MFDTLPVMTPLLNETKLICALTPDACAPVMVEPDDPVHGFDEFPNVHEVISPISVPERPLPFLIVPAMVDTEQLKPPAMIGPEFTPVQLVPPLTVKVVVAKAGAATLRAAAMIPALKAAFARCLSMMILLMRLFSSACGRVDARTDPRFTAT
ncbi:MAG TPA: hypothetical protein VNF47_27190 [Streptosporangiaceae bacterium]|nr:hypothetical protein [Streptosporangiaceae bacterium]